MDAKQKMENVQVALDEYEGKIGLPPTTNPPCAENELTEYLTMPKEVMNGMSIGECDEVCLKLTQSIIYMRRLYNKEVSRISWCDGEISHYVCDKLNTVGGQYDKYDIKVGILAKTDNYLAQILKFKYYAKQRVDRLSNLADDLNGLKFVILEAKKTKMREK